MATRPLTFGIRMRSKGRTLRVRPHERDRRQYVLEVQRDGRTERREHGSLPAAIKDCARIWRNRLH
jgi:hypothetical protein